MKLARSVQWGTRIGATIAMIGSVVFAYTAVVDGNVAHARVGTITGTVFRDFNSNGQMDTTAVSGTAVDIGVESFVVKAFAEGRQVAQVKTKADGTYSISYDTSSEAARVRLEFIPPYENDDVWYSSFAGGTSVQFANNGDVVDYAVRRDGDYSDPATNKVVVPISTYDNDRLKMYDYFGGNETVLATVDQIGSTWGTAAYEATPAATSDRYVLSAAFLQYRSSLGPVAAGDQLGQIYLTNVETGETNAEPWTVVPGIATTPVDPLTMPQFSDQIHTVGLGDMDISTDGKTLYVMDLAARAIRPIPITNLSGDKPLPGIANSPIQTPLDLPNSGVGCYRPMVQPFGMDVTNDEIFVGLTCWGREVQPAVNVDGDRQTYNNSALRGYIYRYDLGTATWDRAPAVEFPFNYFFLAALGGAVDQYNWREWTPTDGWDINVASPTITDLTFDEARSNLTISISSRSAHSIDQNQAAGDILVACSTNFDDTTFAMESGGSCGGTTTVIEQANTKVNPNAGNAKQRPGLGGAEFYNDYMWPNDPSRNHTETAIGSSEIIPGHLSMVTTQVDATSRIGWNGLKYLGTVGNAHPGDMVGATDVVEMGKMQGLGELSVLQDKGPLQIGNRVWIDADGNGIQNPNERPASGIFIELRTADGVTVATAITNEDGEYYFQSNVTEPADGDGDNIGGNLAPNTEYKIVIPASQLAEGARLDGYEVTIKQKNGAGSVNDSDGGLAGSGDVFADVTTGSEGHNDHSIDFGFTPADAALRKTIKAVVQPLAVERTVEFQVEVFNQGGVPLANLEVTDYIDATMWEEFDPGANPSGTAGPAVDESYRTPEAPLTYIWDSTDKRKPVAKLVGVLAPGESVTIPLHLKANEEFNFADADLVNRAEISHMTDDNNRPVEDIDSTPDGIDDDPVIDNEIDPNKDDEDDHDIAIVPDSYDMTLVKRLAPDQTYVVDPTSGAIQVRFVVEVKNQGAATEYTVEVTDYVPDNMRFVSGVADGHTVEFPAAAEFGEDVKFVIDRRGETASPTGIALAESVNLTLTFELATPLERSYVNSAEISGMEALQPNPSNPTEHIFGPVLDIDSVLDSIEDNDEELVATPDMIADDDSINSGVDSHNDIDYDPDQDGDVNEPTPGDEDDADSQEIVIPADVALIKTVAAMAQPLQPNGKVTFDIEVTNQGVLPLRRINIAEYFDTNVFEFVAADNPAGVTTGDAGLNYEWTSLGASLTGTLAPGAVVHVPVTLRVANGYTVSDGPLLNRAEISDIDDDDDPDNDPPVDIDSVPDDDPDNEGPETDNIDDNTDDDEDDSDPAEVPVFDLALRKVLDTEETVLPVDHGDDVLFIIEVFNQGNVAATDISLIDYIDTAKWSFDLAKNPTGLTDGSAALSYSWSAAGANGALSLDGVLNPGQTALLPIVLTVAKYANLNALFNTAEISAATPIDSSGQTVNGLDGSPIPDVDSVADNDNGDVLVDDKIDGTPRDPKNADEDDHDIANVPGPSPQPTTTTVAPATTTAPRPTPTIPDIPTTLPKPTTPVTTLPFDPNSPTLPRLPTSTLAPVPAPIPPGPGYLPETGSNIATLAMAAAALVGLGGLSIIARRRRGSYPERI